MDAFAECLLNSKSTTLPGEMGMRDVQLIEAIYRTAETGTKVSTKDVKQVLDKVSSAAWGITLYQVTSQVEQLLNFWSNETLILGRLNRSVRNVKN